MKVIRNYSDTKNEMAIARHRLNYLEGKKEELQERYSISKSSEIGNSKVQNNTANKDRMAYYMYELTKRQQNGLTIDEEIIQQEKLLKELKKYIRKMERKTS